MKRKQKVSFKIKVSFLAKEQIKKFARDNCLTQDEIDLFSKLVNDLEVEL